MIKPKLALEQSAMVSARKDDANPQRSRYRSRRIFYASDGWYIAMREGERGPFPSKRIATLELRAALRSLSAQPL